MCKTLIAWSRSKILNSKTSAIVLLSGRLDSTTTLAIAKHSGFSVYAITFRYGQRHELEITSACNIAKLFGVTDHVIVDVDLNKWGGSALTGHAAFDLN